MHNKKIYGCVVGTVEGTDDEYGTGRIRVRTTEDPSIVPTDQLPQARYCSPLGGGSNHTGAGFFMVPEIGQQVLLTYEAGDPSKPIFIGCLFAEEEGGKKNSPIEARAVNKEPLNRILRTRAGHSLELDDREFDLTDRATRGVRFLTGEGHGLQVFSDPKKGISLRFGDNTGGLYVNDCGLNLKTRQERGLFVNDEMDYIQLSTTSDTGIHIFDGKINLLSTKGVKIDTQTIDIQSQKRLDIKTLGGGMTFRAGGTQKFVAAQDTIFQNGGGFLVNANQYKFTGQLGSGFTIDLVAPGDGGGSGNIQGNTTSGNVLFRVGQSLTFPSRISPRGTDTGFGANQTSMALNDPAMGAGFLGRVGIGITGNAVLEGALGGVFVSGIPIPHGAASAIGGGRVPVPFAPIIPIGAPGAPQPVPLGGNLYFMIIQMWSALMAVATSLISGGAAFGVGNLGFPVPSPVAIAIGTALQVQLTTIFTTYLVPGLPTSINSSTVFID